MGDGDARREREVSGASRAERLALAEFGGDGLRALLGDGESGGARGTGHGYFLDARERLTSQSGGEDDDPAARSAAVRCEAGDGNDDAARLIRGDAVRGEF